MKHFVNKFRLAGIVILAVMLLVPASAHALNKASSWSSASNALTAKGYNSEVKAYGTWKLTRTQGQVVGLTNGSLKFKNADNHKAFYEVRAQFNAGKCSSGWSLNLKYVGFGQQYSCTQAFYDYSLALRSKDVSTTKGKTSIHSNVLVPTLVNTNASVGRIRIKTCLNIPWRKDICSGTGFSGTDTF